MLDEKWFGIDLSIEFFPDEVIMFYLIDKGEHQKILDFLKLHKFELVLTDFKRKEGYTIRLFIYICIFIMYVHR